MTLDLLAAIAAGAGIAVGLLLIARGATGPLHHPHSAPPGSKRWRTVRRELGDRRRLAIAVGVGVLVGAVTRWPVAGVIAALGAWVLPQLIGGDRTHTRALARIEGIATWTESLRDTLAAAAGLEQAILATAHLAPEAIRPQVQLLAARLRRGDRLPDALRRLAVDLDDATADLVVTALVMAVERHARHIGDLLTSLAGTAREQAGLRMRVAAGRTRIRTSTRVIVTVTLLMAGGLVLLNRAYLQPFDSLFGQLILLAVGGLFGFGFWWLGKISTIDEPDRILTVEPATGQRHGVAA